MISHLICTHLLVDSVTTTYSYGWYIVFVCSDRSVSGGVVAPLPVGHPDGGAGGDGGGGRVLQERTLAGSTLPRLGSEICRFPLRFA